MLTLYTDRFLISPYVFSCFVALKEKGLSFETKAVSLGDKEQTKPEYRQRTVTARVPSIDHDGFVLAESSAILEYLEDAFPAPKHPHILPEGIRERARARQVISWLRSDDTLGLREDRPTTTIFYERTGKPMGERGKAAAQKLLEVADRLVAEGKTSLFGAFSIADADLAFMLQRLLLNGHEASHKLRAFVEAQWKRPSVAEFVAFKRPPFVPY